MATWEVWQAPLIEVSRPAKTFKSLQISGNVYGPFELLGYIDAPTKLEAYPLASALEGYKKGGNTLICEK